jgi:hypothetical protein
MIPHYYSTIGFSNMANIIILFSNIIKFENNTSKLIILCTQTPESINIINSLLPLINKPFIIISGMEDYSFPSEINTNIIINNINFIHWFAINSENNNYTTKLPYGLDYWTIAKKEYFLENKQSIEEQDKKLLAFNNQLLPFHKRLCKIYCNAHLNITDTRHGNYRSQIQNLIDPKIIDYQHIYLKRSDMWNNFINYAFILSPYGNGLDCIRTFEALCLGCIPIIKSSKIDNVYDDLPVLIINDWSELNNKVLSETIEKFSTKKFNYNKLTMQYWMDTILSKIL